MDIKCRYTILTASLYSSFIVCLFCNCMIPNSIKREVQVCYNPNSDYSKYVSVDRIFTLSFKWEEIPAENIPAVQTTTRLIFFKDGLLVMDPVLWNKEYYNLHDTEYLCNKFKSQNYSLKHFYKYGGWGVYNIQNDTIIMQCFNDNSKFLLNEKYSLQTFYFKIINKDSISLINNFKSSKLLEINSYPCEIKLTSGSAWIKREKWLYCENK